MRQAAQDVSKTAVTQDAARPRRHDIALLLSQCCVKDEQYGRGSCSDSIMMVFTSALLLTALVAHSGWCVEVEGFTKRKPPPETLEELLEASDFFVMGQFEIHKIGNLSFAQVKMLRGPCALPQYSHNFNLTFVNDNNQDGADDMIHFQFSDGQVYFLFLEETQKEGVFHALGARKTNETEFHTLITYFCQHFPGEMYHRL